MSSNVVSIWSKAYEERINLKQDIQYITGSKQRNIRQEMVKGYMKLLNK